MPFFGKVLKIKIPTASKLDEIFTVKGKGLKINEHRFGNLLVKPQITMPNQLNEEEKNTLNTLTNNQNFKI